MNAVDREEREREIVDGEKSEFHAAHGAALILLASLLFTGPVVLHHHGFVAWVGTYAAAAILALAISIRALPFRWAIGVAIALRLPFLFVEPALSGDLYRYLWDGKVFAAGVNPYLAAPNAPELAALREPWHDRINHPSIRTIYPPGAQLLFLFFHDIHVWRLLIVTAEIALLVALRRQLQPRVLTLLALLPFAVVEGAWSGHIDSLTGAVVALAAVFTSGSLLGVAVGFKVIPLAIFVPLLRAARSRSRFVAAAFATAATPLAAFALAGAVMPGVREYATRWIFNSPLYSATYGVVHVLGIGERLKALWTSIKDSLGAEAIAPFIYARLYDDFVTRSLMAAVFVATAVVLYRRKAPASDWIGALLLCSPTIHAWYWMTVVPLAALERRFIWIALAVCAPFSYLLYAGVAGWLVMLLCYALPLTVMIVRRRFFSRGVT